MHSHSSVPERSGSRSTAGSSGKHAASSSSGRPRRLRRSGGNEARHRYTRPEYRIIAIGVLGGIATSLVLFEYDFRHLEALVVAHLYRVFTPILAASSAPIIWFGLGRPGAYGLEITPDCSSALLIVPLCGLGILLMIPRRLAVGRVAKGLAVAAVVLVGGNLLRIGVIAAAIRVAGIGTGYQIGHLVLGSIVSFICIATSLVLLTVIVVSRPGVSMADILLRRNRKAVS